MLVRVLPASIPPRHTLQIYLATLKPYLRDGCRFIADTFAYPQKVLRAFQDDRRSSYRCQETDGNSLKKFGPIIRHAHTEGEPELNVFTSALCLVPEPHLHSHVELGCHTYSGFISLFGFTPEHYALSCFYSRPEKFIAVGHAGH